MSSESDQYVPALGYAPLTRFYDIVVGLTTRENTFKSALIAQASIKPGSEILDVACGTGTLALLLKTRHRDANVTGIDGDQTILNIARTKIDKAQISINLDQGLSYELPYTDDQFDIVMSSLFFHHLSRDLKDRTAKEMYRVLKPGGMIHIADWGKPDNGFMALLFYGIQLLDGFSNTDDNRKGLLTQIFIEAGFGDTFARETFATMFGTMVLYSGKKYS